MDSISVVRLGIPEPPRILPGRTSEELVLGNVIRPNSLSITITTADVNKAILIQNEKRDEVLKSVEKTIKELEIDLGATIDEKLFQGIRDDISQYGRSKDSVLLQNAKDKLRQLETDFTRNFKDPSEEIPFNKGLDQVSHDLQEFTKYLRRLALARRIETYYNLAPERNFAEVQELKIDKTNGGTEVSFPLARVLGKLKTEHIFYQSEDLYGIDHGLSKDEKMGQSSQKRDSLFKENISALIRSLFPVDADGVLQPRSEGLIGCLKIHFALMKNFEPEAYNLSLQCAKTIADQSCNKGQRPLMLLPLAAHHSEEYITSHLLPALRDQDIEIANCPIFIFVNGDDEDKIARILSDIDIFKGQPEGNLDINVIVAEPSRWGMGLKSVPLNVGIMTQLIKGSLDDGSADLPVVLFDADTLALEGPNALQDRANFVNEGKTIFAGRYINSPEILTSQNINYFLLNEILEKLDASVVNRQDIFNARIEKDKKSSPSEFLVMGGNGMYSMMILSLLGGIRPYSVAEDVETIRSIIRQFQKAFGVDVKEECERRGIYVDGTETHKVVLDGGSITRTVDLGKPVDGQFLTHEHHNETADTLGLPPIDKSKPTLVNIERLTKELESMCIQIISFSVANIGQYSTVTPGQQWAPEVNEIFIQKIKAFEKHINDLLEALPKTIKFDCNQRPNVVLKVVTNDKNLPPDIELKVGDKELTINLAEIIKRHSK